MTCSYQKIKMRLCFGAAENHVVVVEFAKQVFRHFVSGETALLKKRLGLFQPILMVLDQFLASLGEMMERDAVAWEYLVNIRSECQRVVKRFQEAVK